MTNRQPQAWDSVFGKMPKLLQALQDSDLQDRNFHGFPQRGIYVFYENGRPIYVGRTNGMKKRILQHGRPSSPHNSATFAFLLAVEQAEKCEIDCHSRKRSDLQKSSDFKPFFDVAKERVRNMQVRVVKVPDAIEQTVFEVYAAVQLGTTLEHGGYNDFENH